jgi:hypothetical protein
MLSLRADDIKEYLNEKKEKKIKKEKKEKTKRIIIKEEPTQIQQDIVNLTQQASNIYGAGTLFLKPNLNQNNLLDNFE